MSFPGRILFYLGTGALLMGGYKSSLLLRGSVIPERAMLTSIGKVNGTSNVHLTVTDFEFGKHIVTLKDDGTWQRVWIPLLLPDGSWPDRKVVLHSQHIKNPAQLNAVLKRKTVTGVATNFFQSLGKNQQEQFAPLYPNVNLSGAIALELDGAMPSPWVAYPLLIFGLVGFPWGIKLMFFPRRESPEVLTADDGQAVNGPRR
ncbi:hypothetical protein [Planctomycetes bacterium TBK1r]|uniref:Cytochrome c-type biogenesis protein CcmF C-terminal domain-containing protein n=1 Tax=Stieleria magnilauensis TaxID=2527963 RepID=A0ABX5XXW9_9BACT|nr:hypothetical protein TBK1r_58640 [Planctomycetes bacterium TBK1r]